MPNPLELELLAMARSHHQQSTPTTASPLPDLSPDFFLSASAQSEFRAAQGSRAYAAPVPNQPRVIEARQRTASTDLPDLGALLMERTLRETGMSRDASFVAEDQFSIDFNTEGVLEGSTPPNERARFQIGRESPPDNRFSRENQSMDGEVVSQRTAAGSFRRVPAPVVSRVDTRTAPTRAERVAVSQTEPTRPSVPRDQIKSSYERLLGPSLIDD